MSKLCKFDKEIETWSRFVKCLKWYFVMEDIKLDDDGEQKRIAILLSAIGAPLYV